MNRKDLQCRTPASEVLVPDEGAQILGAREVELFTRQARSSAVKTASLPQGITLEIHKYPNPDVCMLSTLPNLEAETQNLKALNPIYILNIKLLNSHSPKPLNRKQIEKL